MSIRLRPLLALSLCAGLVGGLGLTAASAAPKPACNLVTDDKGDASLLVAPNDASLDIISADVGTNAKKLTAVLRLDKFTAVSPSSPLGRGYYVLFSTPKAEFPIYLNVQITPDLTRFAWGTLETLPSGSGSYVRKGAATGTIDTAKNELRVTVPLAEMNVVAKLKPGVKLTDLKASTTSVLGTSVTGGLVATVDEAEGSNAYSVGAATCVPVGK